MGKQNKVLKLCICQNRVIHNLHATFRHLKPRQYTEMVCFKHFERTLSHEQTNWDKLRNKDVSRTTAKMERFAAIANDL